jgi:hypothetical protein
MQYSHETAKTYIQNIEIELETEIELEIEIVRERERERELLENIRKRNHLYSTDLQMVY